MDKSQILPNRKEYRASMRKFKRLRGLSKKRAKGAFGSTDHFLGRYKSLHVIPLHKRTAKNSNKLGVSNE